MRFISDSRINASGPPEYSLFMPSDFSGMLLYPAKLVVFSGVSLIIFDAPQLGPDEPGI